MGGTFAERFLQKLREDTRLHNEEEKVDNIRIRMKFREERAMLDAVHIVKKQNIDVLRLIIEKEKLEPLAPKSLDLSKLKVKPPTNCSKVYCRQKHMAKSSDGNIFNQSSSSESVKEAGSKNKRKHLSECASHVPVEEVPLSLKEISSYELIDEKLANEFSNLELLDEKIANENSNLESARGSSDIPTEDEVKEYLLADWDDPSECQFEELLAATLYTTFRNAVKKIAECGHSEEDAERVVLRSGFCYGDKDPVSNIVDGALPYLEIKQEVDLSKYQVFDNMQNLVEYTIVEMVNALREVNPSLSVSEAMWILLICDLNLKKAYAMETDVLSGLRSEAVSGGISSNSIVPQIKSEDKTYETIPSNTGKSAISKPSDPRKSQTNIPSEGESSNSQSVRIPFPGGFITTNSQPSNMEDASGVAKKCCSGNSKRELLRQRTLHMEKCRGRMSMPRGAFKSKLTSISCSVMEKKSVAYMKNMSYKESTAAQAKVQATSVSTTATSIPATLPVKDVSAADDKISKLIPPETKPTAGSQINTVPPSKTPDYLAGIPYDESTNKYLPQNSKEELLLVLVAKKEAAEKELQHWSDWTTEKVRVAAHRLGKDKEELKALRQEKEEAEKLVKEKQILEENTMKRLSEMECALTNANAQTDMANSTLSKLEQNNSALKQKLESARLLALKSSVELQETVLKEHETLKKIQISDSEKEVLLENLKSYKNKSAKLQKDLKKAEALRNQNEALWKQEEKGMGKILAQISSTRKERERLEALAKEEGIKIRQKADCELQKFKDNMKDLEEQISKLRMECESSTIAALREGINRNYGSHHSDSNIPAKPGYLISNTNKRLPAFQEISRSESVKEKDRECTMCMEADIFVIFLPCAHQVLCEECNQLHEKQGATTCPICRALIETRIKPRFAKKN